MFMNKEIVDSSEDVETILNIEVSDISYFKTMFSILNNIVDDVNIKFINNDNCGYIQIKKILPCQTILLNMKLENDIFSKYICCEKEIDIGLNIALFYKFIKDIPNDNTLTLFINKNQKDNIIIKTNNILNTEFSKCEIKSIDLENKNLNIPPVSFNLVTTIDSYELATLLSNKSSNTLIKIQSLSDKIIFKYKYNYIVVTNTYTETNKSTNITETTSLGLTTSTNTTENISVDIQCKSDSDNIVQGTFDFNIIKKMFKNKSVTKSFIKEVEKANIYLKKDYPIIIKYDTEKKGKLMICVTPVIVE
jgi:hypothetical protein